MKRILIVYYTQSGQLRDIAEHFISPFKESDDYSIEWLQLEPENDYPFPWTGYTFFDAFPESVLKHPCRLKPIPGEIAGTKYDLVVLAYQVWYMSPSIPVTAFLQSDKGKELLKDTPVITLIGSRNMWLQAQEYVKECVADAGGRIVGNVSLRDRAENLTGIITISWWMFTGRKTRMWGIFPKPGISDEDIQRSCIYGEVLNKAIQQDELSKLQDALLEKGAVKVNPYLISLEARGIKIFRIWAKFIARKGGPGSKSRKFRVRLFGFYLPTAILILAPIIFVLSSIINLLTYKQIRKKINYYKGVELTN